MAAIRSRPFSWPKPPESRELAWLLVALGACVLLLVFVILAGEVVDGDTQAFDGRIVRAFRRASDPSRPIGPPWMENVLFDVTALGGPTVLSLVVLAVAGYLALQARYRTASFIVLTAASGTAVGAVMKSLFARARPTVVVHLRDVTSSSFPSGHAMQSAVVYLTLGAVLMRVVEGRPEKMYCLSVAIVLTVLVGLSRVFLGVHYPTDVLGGWIVGIVWASICWLVAGRWGVRGGRERQRLNRA